MSPEVEALEEAASKLVDALNDDRARLAADALRFKQERDEAIAALKLGPWALHRDDGSERCLCHQCDFVRAKLALLAKVSR